MVNSPRGSLITVATCNLNQWALDFDGNQDRILRSCMEAREQGATYRLGPELEICGYGCEDHFYEADTFFHCWQTLDNLFEEGATDDLLCDFGMPVLFAGVRYNCRVICRDRKVLMIRPKTAMADNGNYREGRYFTAYKLPRDGKVERFQLPKDFADKYQLDKTVPFGTHYLQCADGTTIAAESCEELWTPNAEHISAALNGVEIIGNGSGSHHELRKLDARLGLMINATRKCGGLYLYANQRGCDGSRLYFDGTSMIVCNGKVLAQAEQFDLRDVQTIVATVDLDEIRSYRASIPSFCAQASSTREASGDRTVLADVVLGCGTNSGAPRLRPTCTEEIELKYHSAEEECCLGPACWLWDFLRRSGAAGYFLPLSGGADSASVATIVGCMTIMAYEAAREDPKGTTADDCRRICNKKGEWIPGSPQDLANCMLHTTYMGTENSSSATETRAKKLGEVIGSYHLTIKIDKVVKAIIDVFTYFVKAPNEPKFSSQGGTRAEDLALQNIQARIRMVFAYLLAQLLPWTRNRTGFLLVLGSSNVDEGLRGYLTKYDCSAADLNPIGAISKVDLKKMLKWAADKYDYQVLKEIVDAPPTAELRPIVDGDAKGKEHTQTDEEDMGMTYEELGHFGRLRKISRCGPVSMFRKLVITWGGHLQPSEVATKVKRFFFHYSLNRHKMTVLTPSYHAEGYSPDDNRFDLRQFLYNTKWTRQNDTIDLIVEEMEMEAEEAGMTKLT